MKNSIEKISVHHKREDSDSVKFCIQMEKFALCPYSLSSRPFELLKNLPRIKRDFYWRQPQLAQIAQRVR